MLILLFYTQPQKDLVPLISQIAEQSVEEADLEKEKTDKDLVEESFKGATVKDFKQTVMQSPNFLGEDINKKLWSLKAVKAIQTGDLAAGVTNLYNVIANTLSAQDSKVDYVADKGEYFSEKQIIKLEGNVKIKTKTFILQTESLNYNLKKAYAETNSQAVIKSDFGELFGNKLQSFNNADKLVLTGNVKAILYNKNR